jgi:serine/threonine-protein kinase
LGESDLDLQPLLRRRLLFLYGCGVWGYLLSLIGRVWSKTFHGADAHQGEAVLGSFVAAVVLYTVIFAWLARRPKLSVRQLRVCELIGFGYCAVPLVLEFEFGPVPTVFPVGTYFISTGILVWFMIVTLYGVLIPNTARRASVVVGALTAVGGAIIVSGWVRWEVPTDILVSWVVYLVQFLGLAAGFAIFNSARLNTYRRAAAAARKLGHYQLGAKLGGGGMGEVYLAQHRLLKRPCAVKLIRPEQAGDASMIQRFEREVQAATRLTHPTAVQVYDYGREPDGTFYYVMEYLPGLTLEAVVRRFGPLPPGRVVYVLRQVCGALSEAHALGLVHRDVKPSNVMLCPLGGRFDVGKLLDFGLVKNASSTDPRLTEAGGILGTPDYLSPEQARGADVGPSSDLYALGATAYFLLTGQPPFKEDNVLALLHAHQAFEPAPPSQLNPDVPADLEAAVLRLLAKDPARRYASAAALDAALAACACAGSWTEGDAARWWGDVSPTVGVDPNPHVASTFKVRPE